VQGAAASLSSAFGEEARDAADAWEEDEGRAAQERAKAEAREENASRRRARASALKGEGERAVASGDLAVALGAFGRGLLALRGRSGRGGSSTSGTGLVGCGGSVAAASTSKVAACAAEGRAAATTAESGGGGGGGGEETVRRGGAAERQALGPGADDDPEATRQLCAALLEARAQVLLLMQPGEADATQPPVAGHVRCGGGTAGPLHRAARSAEEAVAISPRWAPGWLTLGRALLALGDSERARAALGRAARLDSAFFDAEGGAGDLDDATRLVVDACVGEAAAEVAAADARQFAWRGAFDPGEEDDEEDEEEGCQELAQRWRARLVAGRPTVE